MIDPELIKIGALTAVSVWGVTQAIKPTIKKWAVDGWARTIIRLTCLTLGCAGGYIIKSDGYGILAGCCGAALSAVVVAAVKAKIGERKSL